MNVFNAMIYFSYSWLQCWSTLEWYTVWGLSNRNFPESALWGSVYSMQGGLDNYSYSQYKPGPLFTYVLFIN